jgi:hypothetical protein
MLRELNLCAGNQRGYRALMGRMLDRVLGLGVVLAVALVAPSVASASPNGIVAGWQSPTDGEMELTVLATPDTSGAALSSATATLGGEAVATESFTDGTCSESCPARVELAVDTCDPDDDGKCRRPDGDRLLVVTIDDVNGGQSQILRQMITVENTKPAPPCVVTRHTCTLTVQIGSGTITPQPSPGGGSVGGESGPVCASPRLSMRLASKPLRRRRGVPVLAAGRTYRYAGTLTCRINGRRRPAPRGTQVQVRNRLRGWTISKPSITLRKAGDVVVRLSYRSSRVVIFRVRAASGDVVRVRIPIRVVKVKKGRR